MTVGLEQEPRDSGFEGPVQSMVSRDSMARTRDIDLLEDPFCAFLVIEGVITCSLIGTPASERRVP